MATAGTIFTIIVCAFLIAMVVVDLATPRKYKKIIRGMRSSFRWY